MRNPLIQNADLLIATAGGILVIIGCRGFQKNELLATTNV